MRVWPVLLLAACGAADTPAPAAAVDPQANHGGVPPVPAADALDHVGVTAEVPAGFETRILDEGNIRLDGFDMMIGLSRLEAQDVPTVAAFMAKGYFHESAQVQSSDEWEGGWVGVFTVPTDPMRLVQGVIRAGKHDVFCAAVETDEVRKDTVEIARKFCRSVRPR